MDRYAIALGKKAPKKDLFDNCSSILCKGERHYCNIQNIAIEKSNDDQNIGINFYTHKYLANLKLWDEIILLYKKGSQVITLIVREFSFSDTEILGLINYNISGIVIEWKYFKEDAK